MVAAFLVYSSKTIITLPRTNTHSAIVTAASRTVPRREVKRFKDQNLALTANPAHAKKKGWERKPGTYTLRIVTGDATDSIHAVNIGNMRRSTGPAHNFTRKR